MGRYYVSSIIKINILVLVLFGILIASSKEESLFKVYPLGEDYFQKIYLVKHNHRPFYLTISCKQANMLSLSITTQREFVQSPTFNIYGNLQNKPKMARGIYTFLTECHCYVDVNTTNFLEIKRQKSGLPIFALTNLTFSEGHIQFTVYDKSTKWGFGERFQHNFHISDGKWTIWNRDKPWRIDEGKTGLSEQTYGHHPVYLARERQTKLYHLSYFKNTHGLLVQSKDKSNELIYNVIGGNLQFLIIIGRQNPEEVLQRYHEYIGKGHIPPFWSFGHHQCRWGYKNYNQIKTVIDQYNNHDIPLDTMWSDLEYMNQKMIFTINENSHQPTALNNLIQREQLHFVPLLDVGVAINDLEAIKLGTQMNVFLKDPNSKTKLYTGEVWPGTVHFVDYLHPNSSSFWKNQLARLYSKLKFSGIWLDMNEPSNFRGGEGVLNEFFKVQQNQNLNVMTISSQLDHYNERNRSAPLKHREVHAYFGHLSTVPTFQFLNEKGRPFIISRSTSVGSGHFVGHWTGDNVATWQFLRLSISGNFLFQIFGIQMVGADICGFYESTTQELCARWHQIGVFYPFARNHNHQSAASQQPYAFGQMLLETSRDSIKTRYALLKQLYTIYLQKKGKGSYYRPLIFQFYDDEKAYEQQYVETQVLIGRYLMTTPIVYQSVNQRNVFFPGVDTQWYKFQTDSHTGKVKPQSITYFESQTIGSITNTLPSPPPLFLRSGFLIFTNYPENRSKKLNNVFHIFAAMDSKNESSGNILGIDDYNNQEHIKKCISDNCGYRVLIKKKNEITYAVQWQYVGSAEVRGTIRLKSFTLAYKQNRYKSDTLVQISTVKGEVLIKIQMI